MTNILEYKGYYGTVEYSSDDDILHGKVIGLNKSFISYEGESVKELKKDFMQAIDDYIDSFPDEKGIEKPCKGTFNVRLNPELHIMAVLKARENNQTLNAFVKEAIMAAINR